MDLKSFEHGSGLGLRPMILPQFLGDPVVTGMETPHWMEHLLIATGREFGGPELRESDHREPLGDLPLKELIGNGPTPTIGWRKLPVGKVS